MVMSKPAYAVSCSRNLAMTLPGIRPGASRGTCNATQAAVEFGCQPVDDVCCRDSSGVSSVSESFNEPGCEVCRQGEPLAGSSGLDKIEDCASSFKAINSYFTANLLRCRHCGTTWLQGYHESFDGLPVEAEWGVRTWIFRALTFERTAEIEAARGTGSLDIDSFAVADAATYNWRNPHHLAFIEKARGTERPRIHVVQRTTRRAPAPHGTTDGRWIDADQDPQEILSQIMQFIGRRADAAKRPGAPTNSWAIDDNDRFHWPGLVGNESLARISLIAKGIVEHGRDVISAYLANDRDKDLTGITEAFVNAVKFFNWRVVYAFCKLYPGIDVDLIGMSLVGSFDDLDGYRSWLAVGRPGWSNEAIKDSAVNVVDLEEFDPTAIDRSQVQAVRPREGDPLLVFWLNRKLPRGPDGSVGLH